MSYRIVAPIVFVLVLLGLYAAGVGQEEPTPASAPTPQSSSDAALRSLRIP